MRRNSFLIICFLATLLGCGGSDDEAQTKPSGGTTYAIRINCGGDEITLDDGRIFLADEAYPGSGSAGYIGGETGTEQEWYINGVICSIRDFVWYGNFGQVYPVLEAALFYSGRRNPEEYRFDLPNGNYLVQLHFSEMEVHGQGFSIFDVIIEGDTVLDDLDVYDQAGRYVGLKIGFQVEVTDGQLNVQMVPELGVLGTWGFPQMNAIEVLWSPPDSTPPDDLVDVFGVASYGLNGLYWDPSLDSDIAGYNVYRNAGSGYEKISQNPLGVSFYRDYNVMWGANYSYRIAPVDVYGNEGDLSPDIMLSPFDITESSLDVYSLTIDPADLLALEENPFLDDYYPAAFEFDGVVYSDPKARYRGSTSRRAEKKSWKVNFKSENLFLGYIDKLNLKAEFLNVFKLSEFLSFRLFKDLRLPSSDVHPIVLEVNGRFRGQFLDIENPDEIFLEQRGLDSSGNLYKVRCFDMSWPIHTNLYQECIDKKTGPDDHLDLEAFVQAVNLTSPDALAETIASYLNIPAYLDYISMMIFSSNNDFTHGNYFLYQNPVDEKWVVIPWDLDYSFDRSFGTPLAPIDYGTQNSPQSIYELWNKLEDQFLSVPQFRFAYCQNLRRLLNTIFTQEYTFPIINDYFVLIADGVRRDLMKDLGGWNTAFEMGPYEVSSYIIDQRANLLGVLYDYMPELEGVLYINEFMAKNHRTLADERGEYDDWIEIYNGGHVAIDLGGMFMTDDPANTHKWTLPEVTLEPGDFLLIWADDDEEQGSLHANFKLDTGDEYIGLYDLDENGHGLIDEVTFGAQTTDVAYGRCPDGSSLFQFFGTEESTPGETNCPETPPWGAASVIQIREIVCCLSLFLLDLS